jgi:uncharacterized repeat protein (TIGR03803 family)
VVDVKISSGDSCSIRQNYHKSFPQVKRGGPLVIERRKLQEHDILLTNVRLPGRDEEERDMTGTVRSRMLGTIFALAAFAPPAQAQTYTVLHTFTGTDGESPLGLVRDSAGNLYGVTQLGGASGQGVVFKLDATGETVLYSFTGGADGSYPTIGLARDADGNLYGTTAGGASPFGEVFKLDTAGAQTVLHSFTGGADGGQPNGLLSDPAGNLYATTYSGGSLGRGVAYNLAAAGTETVLHNFGGLHGGNPASALIRAAEGNFYGTTWQAGSAGYGVVFKLGSTGAETVLYDFTGGADGADPYAPLIRDSAGNLYGTTSFGGIVRSQVCPRGCGVVFKLDTTGTETVLHSFTGGADGMNPSTGLISDSAGNLYGTTPTGGASGWGVVFEVNTAGTETVLYSFKGGDDGGKPEAGLIRDLPGNLYGTAIYSESGFGVVFKIAP